VYVNEELVVVVVVVVVVVIRRRGGVVIDENERNLVRCNASDESGRVRQGR
jgi:hypothetical protein